MTDSAKPTGTDDKIKGAQPKEHTADPASRPVEEAAEKVGKPAEEPVERTADLLQKEAEVTQAGNNAPSGEQPRPAR
jgi:hypothetical protein